MSLCLSINKSNIELFLELANEKSLRDLKISHFQDFDAGTFGLFLNLI